MTRSPRPFNANSIGSRPHLWTPRILRCGMRTGMGAMEAGASPAREAAERLLDLPAGSIEQGGGGVRPRPDSGAHGTLREPPALPIGGVRRKCAGGDPG
jgi:hypothetical protein